MIDNKQLITIISDNFGRMLAMIAGVAVARVFPEVPAWAFMFLIIPALYGASVMLDVLFKDRFIQWVTPQQQK